MFYGWGVEKMFVQCASNSILTLIKGYVGISLLLICEVETIIRNVNRLGLMNASEPLSMLMAMPSKLRLKYSLQ